MKVLVSPHRDVYTNLALEERLFSKGEEVLFLWVNSPCVVLGYHQNAYREINFPYVREKGIAVARRLTGGGAVYHDLGNLNVSLIEPASREPALSSLLLEVLQEAGLSAISTPSNDFVLNGKKFCGQASYEARGTRLSHACLLVETDLDALEKALAPSPLKLESHAIESVRSRVINLSSAQKGIRVITLIERFASRFGGVSSWAGISEGEIASRAKEFQDPGFVYGKNPPFDVEWELSLDGDVVSVRLGVEEGVVKTVAWNSDGERNPSYAEQLEKLKGKTLEEIGESPLAPQEIAHSRR